MTLDYPVPFHTPNLVWDSTIAIYLFLLGISSGAVQLAIAYKRSNKLENPSKNWIIRAAAVLGSVPTLIGLTLLIFHLARPWTFWKLMFNYQFNSVMSMGVMLFQVYMLFLVCWCAVIFKEDIMAFIQRFMPKLGFVGKIINHIYWGFQPCEVLVSEVFSHSANVSRHFLIFVQPLFFLLFSRDKVVDCIQVER